jgi:hypothetical protein
MLARGFVDDALDVPAGRRRRAVVRPSEAAFERWWSLHGSAGERGCPPDSCFLRRVDPYADRVGARIDVRTGFKLFD